ncbi:DeoR/GlpR family DNA-binding transcription regulator [Desulfovibrio sp. OttesenSCG-928-F07]|nr:DeoR/GlpR family DNA-binding transcription regulator [Desulfovibrio sp. OttesenSCG-928-F07]
MKQSRTVILQRREKILRMLLEQGEVHVKELCVLFGTSEITIRRDLHELEQRGLLRRFHGGAQAMHQSHELLYFEDKRSRRKHEKDLIADTLVEMIEPGTTVFMNAGTTTLAVMSRIRDYNIRVITNNAMATTALAGGSAELICTGGEYQDRTKSFCGDFATYIIGNLYADLCILGVNGVSVAGGITTTFYNETQINELMIKRCHGKTIIAADGSKIGKTFCFTCMPLSHVDVLVTDSSADMNEIEQIKRLGLKVVIVG